MIGSENSIGIGEQQKLDLYYYGSVSVELWIFKVEIVRMVGRLVIAIFGTERNNVI